MAIKHSRELRNRALDALLTMRTPPSVREEVETDVISVELNVTTITITLRNGERLALEVRILEPDPVVKAAWEAKGDWSKAFDEFE